MLRISDADSGENAFRGQTGVAGSYGSFSVDDGGSWTYSADNRQSAIKSLGPGDRLTETFTVTSVGSATHPVVITIAGVNDAPVALTEIQSSANTGGFVINAVATGDGFGDSLSGAGDVNGDGLGDLVVGATHASANGESSGASYVVFGNADGAPVEVTATADNANAGGFVIRGAMLRDRPAYAGSAAGDVNGDGFDDLLVGAAGADPSCRCRSRWNNRHPAQCAHGA